MGPVIENLTPWTWHEYVTNLAMDETIIRWMVGIGFFYAICAVLCLFYEKLPTWVRWPIYLGVVGLVALALLYMKEIFMHVGQFFEYTLQFSAPLFLVSYYKKSGFTPRLVFFMKLTVALTFMCHGLYALNYYPRPGVFTSMTMRLLGCSEDFAIHFLTVAGWLDLVVAVGIFLPNRWAKWFVLYAFLWGSVTTLARLMGNFYWDFPLQCLHEWAYHMVYRFPHALIPLVILLAIRRDQNKNAPKVP